jgi:hypothetical protein
MMGDRNPPQEPPCDTCQDEKKRVELLPENEQAAKLFLMCRSQCQTRFNGERDLEIDLDHVALWKAIEKFPGGIQDEWETFGKISRAWHESQRKKRDSDG